MAGGGCVERRVGAEGRSRRLLSGTWRRVRTAERQALEERLSFADPGTGRVVEWHESRRRVYWLDRVGDQTWVVPKLSTPCESGFGHLPLWQAYQLRDGQWYAVDLADVPVVPVCNMLTTDYPVTKPLRYVSLSDKQRLNAPYRHCAIDTVSKRGC